MGKLYAIDFEEIMAEDWRVRAFFLALLSRDPTSWLLQTRHTSLCMVRAALHAMLVDRCLF